MVYSCIPLPSATDGKLKEDTHMFLLAKYSEKDSDDVKRVSASGVKACGLMRQRRTDV